jgi:hypothetical protein
MWPIKIQIATRGKHRSTSAGHSYFFEFKHQAKRLRSRFTEQSVYLYLDETEEAFRSKAIEYARATDKFPFSLALLKSLKDASLWKSFRDTLVPRRGAQFSRNESGNRNEVSDVHDHGHRASGGCRGQDASRSGSAKTKKKKTKYPKVEYQTVPDFGGSQRVCKRFNDLRGCTNPNCHLAHLCDLILENGKPCKGKHARKVHNFQQHGACIKRHH